MRKMKTGGYLSGLEKYPDLQKTIQNYRDRLKNDQALLQKFDKTATSQLQATKNMPTAERSAYIADIQKQYAKPSDEQFAAIKADLKSDKRIRPTYRYPVDTESYGPTTGYYRNLSDEIAQKQKDIDALKVTETSTKKVPQYTYYKGASGTPGLAGSRPGVATTTTEIPKGATYRPASQSGFTSTPAGYVGPDGTTYTQQGTKNVTVSNTRAAKAGDPSYDKAMSELGRLQKRHDYRNVYLSEQPSQLTGQNIYSSLGMTSPSPQQTRRQPRGVQTAFASFLKPRTLKKGGEIQGKGKAVRGFKFGGIK